MNINLFIREPHRLLQVIARTGAFNFLPDKAYLNLLYFATFGKKMNFANPITFNEKIQWLKLYDRNPQYTTMVDKYAVKQYVASVIGAEYLIPTLGVWEKFDDIDFNKLPDQFVLKCTHDSGGLVICRDKSQFDAKAAKKKIERSLKRNYYYSGREWPYKNVQPRIIAEKYMVEGDGNELNDYKFMMFGGIEKCAFVCSNRFSERGLNVTFYDTDWKIMPFDRHYPRSTIPIKKPYSYTQMVCLAEKLSKDIPFVRIDFYEIKGKPYFGEITFYPGSGFEDFSPIEWDNTLGDWINLPYTQGNSNRDNISVLNK